MQKQFYRYMPVQLLHGEKLDQEIPQAKHFKTNME